jgi:hypothetical protein
VVTLKVQLIPSSHAAHGVAVPASQVSPAPESITPSPHWAEQSSSLDWSQPEGQQPSPEEQTSINVVRSHAAVQFSEEPE